MEIELTENFWASFEKIYTYIAKDKLSAAQNFRRRLLEQIKTIPDFPYQYRQSRYYDNHNYRDMIFRKYTIVYTIDTPADRIIVLDIFNRNQPL